ncbi:MAG: DUF4445 domain-containing protein [Chloroflexi bacterium]|nr:DUF4445 domain-containing protein [Chloroflexota bacterium]
MSANREKLTVTFQPDQISVKVPPGTLLVDAAAEGGVFIDVPCGGQGRCGRCLVKIDRGEVSHRESPYLTQQQQAEGWALSCVARVASDLVVSVPPKRERLAVETAASRGALRIRSDWPRYPAVRRLHLEMSPPSLEDNASDMERLRATISRELGIDELTVDLSLLKNLASILREGDWRVTATVDMGGPGSEGHLIDLRSGQISGPLLAVAVDVGTTTVAVCLVDLKSGRLIDRITAFNRQISCGEDVISRIIYSQRGQGLEHLQRLVVETINEILAELGRKHHFGTEEISEVVAAGNTTMTHLFLGLPARHIREEPYVPTANLFPRVTAGELGLAANPRASVYCVPGVAAYVGGDITAGVLSSGLYKTDKLTLFLDVGTNGEIVLGNREWMTTCACSAGPAFEGAGVRCGMRAEKGAIEDVRIHSQTLEPTVQVIGGGKPLGICGSGMISALAEMLITDIIDKGGRFNTRLIEEGARVRLGDHGPEYVVAWASESAAGRDIVLTEVDINNLIRTKGAIYAGIAVMARQVGVDLSEVEQVLIGGAFGQHINVEEAIQVGLLPDLPWDRFQFLGNTSVWGAYNVLLSKQARAKAEEVARGMTYLELIADNTFMDEFTSALFLPHTNVDRFPSVKVLLAK